MSLLDKLPTDFFGSDVFINYQGSYVWQANQLGHIAIGLTYASFFSWVFQHWKFPDFLLYLACGAGVMIYLGKEIIDLAIAKRQAQRGLFNLNQRELWCDMVADTWFVASGVGMVAAAHSVNWWGLVAFGIAVLMFWLLARKFVPAKKSLDRAGLPYMFRLCNFPKTEGFNEHNIHRIQAFIRDKPINCFEPSKAILIQGHRGTGKSALAVGIATEVALQKRHGKYGRSRYFTAFSLFEQGIGTVRSQAAPVKRRIRRLLGTGDPWSENCAELLVIDDVDSDNGVYGAKTPAQILAELKKNPQLCQILKQKKTVWVTGTGQFGNLCASHGWIAWHDALCAFYNCGIQPQRTGCGPAEIQAREPIPVIWLQERLV